LAPARPLSLTSPPPPSILFPQLGTIHYDSDFGTVYFAVTAPEYPQRTAFALLSEFKEGFKNDFGDQLDGALEGGLTKAARRGFFPGLAGKWDDLAGVDRIHGVMQQVEETKGVMHNNIQKIMENHDSLDVGGHLFFLASGFFFFLVFWFFWKGVVVVARLYFLFLFFFNDVFLVHAAVWWLVWLLKV
jgi:hypothetical protein